METVFVKTRSDLQKERVKFALFVALACHALIVFGIGFKVLQTKSAGRTIDVTLALHNSEEAPDKADFIAQANQQGSGATEDARKLTTNMIADDNLSNLQHQQHRQSAAQAATKKTPVITALGSELNQSKQPSIAPLSADQQAIDSKNTPQQTIESLKALIDQQRNEYSKMPRVRRLTLQSTKSADEAAYLLYWIQRSERIGNENYPEEARRKKIYGELRLAVILLHDGSIDSIEVLESSGVRILDLAAMRTVRLAAPFAPFSESMKAYDKYEIIRTWRYLADDSLTTEAQ